MAAVSGAAVAKIAATVLTDKKLRKGVGWLLAAVLSPLILFVVMLCTLLSATSQHNTAAADLCFYGGEISENTPVIISRFQYRVYTLMIPSIHANDTASIRLDTALVGGIHHRQIFFFARCSRIFISPEYTETAR